MQIGMLWFDNNPNKKLEEKVQHAVSYYKNKYGASPTLCYVNPCMLNSKQVTQSNDKSKSVRTGGIEIRPSKAILPDHFWIGINSAKNSSSAK